MRLPKSFYSWTTISGAVLASVSFLLIVFTLVINLFIYPSEGGDYLGLFTYIILPVFLVIGLIMIPVGTVRKMKRDKKGRVQREVKFPIVNLNDPSQRMVVLIFVAGTAIFLLFTALGSYEVFHYTESNEFCGTLCHAVMEPEYVTYHGSAHARVNCVECHVGSGANWYVKSKLSGLYQVYSVIVKAYPTPIETPVHNLRPAQETCEKCHWPEKFYDPKYITKKHYLGDEENTEWNIQLLMKTGPEHKAMGQSEGIHWHINPDVKIEYTSNWKRDTITEVKYTNLSTGDTRVYKNHASPEDTLIATSETRTMDCLDCHNRPSHDYLSPAHFINNKMASGSISPDIPEIKMLTMEILAREFPTKDSAFNYISTKINSYYDKNYTEFAGANQADLEEAILAIQDGYQKNVFPFMKAQWSVYPNHLGHIESNGCTRCHNDSFKSTDGHTISRDCDLCHTIKAQGPAGEMEYAFADSSLMFNHPFEMDDWKEMACFECHQELY
ncbi:MAG: NapC/NirT family cytochrome c [Bacteroidales bacterium]|nr:NapC/NirT family cytochrome c [Bacteroidales bacterium]